MSELAKNIVDRIFEANGKGQLESLLGQNKKDRNHLRNEYAVTGSAEEIKQLCSQLVDQGKLNIDQLRTLANDLEENGSQHIFLFQLGDDTFTSIANFNFTSELPPEGDLLDIYDEAPEDNHLYLASATEEEIVIKQICQAHYWYKDRERSTQTDDEIVLVRRRATKRAVNLIKIDLAQKSYEVRISRISGEQVNQDKIGLELFSQLMHAIPKDINPLGSAIPLDAEAAFRRIIKDRTSIHMHLDNASDPDFRKAVKSTRERGRGEDVRDSPGYDLDNERFERDAVSCYFINSDDSPRMIHFTLSMESMSSDTGGVIALTKLYIGANLSPEELNEVLTYIRASAQ